MINLSIVLPAYLESENLKKILPEIKDVISKLNINYEILVIDTINCIDDTSIVCKNNNVVYFNRENSNSYGDAIRTGIRKSNGNYLLVMDADGSHNPSDIIKIYNKAIEEELDVVVGSRYCKGGKTDNSFILKFMSWVLNNTYRIIFNLKVKDCSNSFRLYNSEKIKSIDLECDNFDVVEEILIKLQLKYKNLKITEVPVHFKKRDKGVSKRNLIKFIFSYVLTIKKLLDIKNKSIYN